MSEYPEHDKLQALIKVSDASQAVGAFLDTGPYQLCELTDSGKVNMDDEPVMEYLPVRKPIAQICGEIFGVDYDQLMNEKDAMLDRMREQNDELADAALRGGILHGTEREDEDPYK